MKKMQQLIVTLASTVVFLVSSTTLAATPNTTNSGKASTVSRTSANPNGQPLEGHIWNLQNADIRSVIDEVSKETGKNFIIDPRVNGKVSIISSKPISPDKVYSVFLSVLQVLGYSAVADGNLVKIVPNNEAKQ